VNFYNNEVCITNLLLLAVAL